MRPTRRTQPYRQGAREPGMALDAMLLGRQPGVVNGADFDRQRAQQGLQALLQQRMRPRPTFGTAGIFGSGLDRGVPASDPMQVTSGDTFAGGPSTIPMQPMAGGNHQRAAELHSLILEALQAHARHGGRPIAHI